MNLEFSATMAIHYYGSIMDLYLNSTLGDRANGLLNFSSREPD